MPCNDVHQAFIDFADSLLPDGRARKLFARMVDRSGIAHRYSHLRPNPPSRSGASPTSGG